MLLLNLAGLLEAPTDISITTVTGGSVVMSWSPPFTLDGVPILHYSVYITSQRLSEQRNTTEVVGVESVNVSWSPPFTLDGVPILHYSVYITSQGLSEQRNVGE